MKDNMDKLIDKYFDLQSELHNAFGYVQDWAVIPMDDCRDVYWFIAGSEESGMVYWSPERFEDTDLEKGDKLYYGPIYTQRHLPKWVYRANGYALISVDMQCDGNRLLFILDEKKECKNEEVIRKLKNHWG